MKQVFKFIGMIFKVIWKIINFIRLAIFNIFFFLVLALIYIGYTQTSIEAPQFQLRESSALVLNISGPIVEQKRYMAPFDSLSGSVLGADKPKENSLFEIVNTLRYATTDNQISGLILQLGGMSETNLTKLRYIGKAITEFKSSGKPVYAVGSIFSQSQYYLASFADEIMMSPDGMVVLQGYSSYPLFYKTLLDGLDVNTHVFRVGTYKSAVEPFVRNNMSDEAKSAASAWLNQLWAAYTSDVAKNRQIGTEVLTPSMDQFLTQLRAVNGDLAKLSLQLGLVDKLATRQEIRSEFKQVFGDKPKSDSYKYVSYYDYSAAVPSEYILTQSSADGTEQDSAATQSTANNEIAIVVANGAIMDGKQPRGTVGAENISQLLRQARIDKQVKAVVLRVDSPGGSAFASEVIRNEIEALRLAGKPVVASMSSVAASGGYWIAMSADKIVAQPTTLTGSIGIFSVIPTFEKTLDAFGIHSDGVGTTPFSGMGLASGISDQLGEVLQLGIENGYQRFTSLVSANRDIPIEQVDRIAQGRVWTGEDAQNLGLVDSLGDFDDAIKLAADLAKVNDYKLYWIDEPLSTTEELLLQFMENVSVGLGIDLNSHFIESLIPDALQPMAKQLISDTELLSQLNDPKGYYSLCLSCEVQ